jgi:hypothetical protein
LTPSHFPVHLQSLSQTLSGPLKELASRIPSSFS